MSQIMRNAVALAAFRELCQYSRRMRCTMTVLAPGYHLVFCLVAESAC